MIDKRTEELRAIAEQLNSTVGILVREFQVLIKELRLNTKAVNEQNAIEKRGQLALLAEMGMQMDPTAEEGEEREEDGA
jgi:hypothetical protein